MADEKHDDQTHEQPENHDREDESVPSLREISDPRALRALAHPTRIALIELLALRGGTLTATQASELVDESPTNCAFHLRTLAKYGYVEQAEGGRGRERPWRLADAAFDLSTDENGTERSRAAGEVSRVLSERNFDRIRAHEANPHAVPPEVRKMAGSWRTFWFVTPEEMAELHERLNDLVLSYRDRTDPNRRPVGAVPMQAVFYVTPITSPGFDNGVATDSAEATPKHTPDPKQHSKGV